MQKLRHIGFIMDGNRRWAKARGLSHEAGHYEGVEALKRVVRACSELKVEYVSVFAFSTENWKRTKREVDAIFELVEKFSKTPPEEIRLKFSGSIDKLPQKIVDAVRFAEEKTKNNGGLLLNICLNYGGRDEIVNAVNKILDKKLSRVGEKTLEKYLDTYPLPPLDAVVRTGGEMRLSNFMLYSAAYAELFFIDTLWPDITEKDILSVYEKYLSRQRKFGGD